MPEGSTHHHRIGLHRRELLQVGCSGLLGLGLPSILGGQASANSRAVEPNVGQSPKQVLIIFLTGAPSHHDTFDMKPEAPAEVRGEFQTIATKQPGLHICEHLPELAKRTDKYALVRSFTHNDNNHLMSTHYVLTGELQPGGFFDKIASRDDWPNYAGACAYARPRSDGIPAGVNLPTFLQDGPLTWPGQHAGFLGPKYDPWQIVGDPNKPDFRVNNLTLASGLDVARLDNRRSLLSDFNQQQELLAAAAVSRRLTSEQALAANMLTSSRLSQAFQMNRESDAVRDRYGRHTTGQSILLGRRLIEAGVPVVQVNIGRVQNWDSHSDIFPTLKGRLLPPLDQGVSALLDDVHASGLINNMLIMMLGEFGRTPKINNTKGRDHWGQSFFGLFAGGGIRHGNVVGRSDKTGSYPATTPYSPHDIGATVYTALGIQPDMEVRDRFDRAIRLNKGRVIESLYTGADS